MSKITLNSQVVISPSGARLDSTVIQVVHQTIQVVMHQFKKGQV